MSRIEFQKSKPLRGMPKLQGDTLLSCHGIFLAAIAQGNSRLENVPQSQWFNDLLDIFIRLGYSFSLENSSVTIHGKRKTPKSLDTPICPKHEIVLMSLGGIFAGFKSSNLLEIDSQYIPKGSADVFLKLFHCMPVKTSECQEEARIFKILELRNNYSANVQEEYLIKTGKLYYHASSQTGVKLQLIDPGPDHLEKLLLNSELRLSCKNPDRKK